MSRYITIDACSVILQGKNVDKAKLNTEGKGLPYIVGASCLQEGRLKCKSYCENTDKQVISQLGDVIISVVGTLGKMAVNDIGDCVLSKHVCAVRFVPQIIPGYGLLCLMGAISYCIPPDDGMQTGFSRKLESEEIGRLPLLLLTLNEQSITVQHMAFLTAGLQTKPTEKLDPADLPDDPVELAEWYRRKSARLLREQHKALNKVVELLKSSNISLDHDDQITLEDLL